MTQLHLEAIGLTLSTLLLVAVMLSTHQNRVYLVMLTVFTVTVLFAAIAAWFCLFQPKTMPRQIVDYATTASWWTLPLFAGVVVAINYSQSTDAEKQQMRTRLLTVGVLGILIALGLSLLTLCTM
ncbi:hypothetical protein FAES_3631 [Fibrella aestuarina BUZ 2]|uniref:Uncharacterized protein n=1 Tax=Fibrella aestuarina BUZ 2 TaxID=1166018 RepID=I0KBY5_9BACT|nr:hypothetical protein [Fibrella aestuarina]CCH01638.1 hypothetical protein FAES_3631 [Fibrella aestuarina BUZ 2]